MILIKWWRIFSIALICAIPVGCNYGCGWYPLTEEYRFAAFNPITVSNSIYKPFFFTTQFMHSYDPTADIQKDRAKNIQEWELYLHHKVDSASIDYLLYTVEPVAYREVLAGSTYVDYQGIKANKFYQLIHTEKYKALGDYMDLAKHFETEIWYEDPWEDDMDSSDMNEQIDLCYSEMEKCKDPFLRLRYAFQYIRLATYEPGKNKIEEVYKKEVETYKPTTIIKHWARYYYTLHLARKGSNVLASYHASQVFKLSDEKRRPVFFLFDGMSAEGALAYAKNNEERGDVLGLASLKDTGKKLNAIKQIMQFAPNHRMLELLVTREINKLEAAILTPQVNGYKVGVYYFGTGDEYRPENTLSVYHAEYGRQMLAYLQSCANNQKLENKAFWNLAAAHTAFVLGQDSTALVYIHAAEQYSHKAATGIQMQITLTGLMAEARMAKTIDAAFEARIYKSVQWLQDHPQHTDAGKLLKQFMAFLSTNYKHQGDLAKGALCRRISKVYYNSPLESYIYTGEGEDEQYYNSLSDAEKNDGLDEFTCRFISTSGTGAQAAELVRLMKEKKKTPFEKWLCGNLPNSKDFMNYAYDITGTLYLQEDNLPEAARYYKLVDGKWWKGEGRYGPRFSYLDANSFHAKFGYNHKATAADTVTYTKYEFVTKLIKLKQKLQTTPDDATYLAVADAYYNITAYGNSWQIVREHSSRLSYYFYPLYDEAYYGCRRAREYYTNAMAHVTNKESKAHCCAMIALCDRYNTMQLYSLKHHDTYTTIPDGLRINNNLYFNKLLKEYGNTEYVTALIAECKGRKAFVGFFTNSF